MKKLLGTVALLAASAAAIAADLPRARNRTQDGDTPFLVNKGGVQTEAGRIDGATAGWLIGPTGIATSNVNGAIHKVYGNLVAGFVSSSAGSGEFAVGSNTRFGSGSAQAARTDSTTGGTGITFTNQTSDTVAALVFGANTAGQATSTNSATKGYMTQDGSWALGVGITPSSYVSLGQATGSIAQWSCTAAPTQTCTTMCTTEPTGVDTGSGQCIAAWTSGNNPSTCATSAANQHCLCAGTKL
jgi:hypothetical protein